MYLDPQHCFLICNKILKVVLTLSSAMDWRFLSGFCCLTAPELLGLPQGQPLATGRLRPPRLMQMRQMTKPRKHYILSLSQAEFGDYSRQKTKTETRKLIKKSSNYKVNCVADADPSGTNLFSGFGSEICDNSDSLHVRPLAVVIFVWFGYPNLTPVSRSK